MDPLYNPFTPGAGVAPPALIGRDRLIAQTDMVLRRVLAGRFARSLMATGLRGVGKTVLLNVFEEHARQLGYQVALIEVPEPERKLKRNQVRADFSTILAPKLRSILFALDRLGGVNEKVKRALRIFTGFSVKLNVDGSLNLDVGVDAERGTADTGQLDHDLTALFEAIGEAAAARSVGLFLAVDEVQYLTRQELGAIITALHRISQRALPVVFVGAGLPQLPGLAGEAKSYAERLFEFPRVTSLAPDEARSALLDPVAKLGVSFTGDALARIVERTQGYPYFIQEFGAKAWDHARGPRVTLEDIHDVEPIVQQELDNNFFSVRFERLTPRERAYAYALATLGAGSHRSGDVARVLNATSDQVGTIRESLITKGMIYSPEHAETEFTVPLFYEFALRRMKPGEGEPRIPSRIRRG